MTFFRCLASAIAALAMGFGSAAAQTTELLPVGRILLDGVLAREKAAQAATDPFSPRFREAAPRFPIESCAFAGGLCGAIDRDGRVVVPPRYDWVDTFAEGRAMVRSKALYGIVDETGREIVAPRFEGLARFQDGLAIFDVDGKMGTIDRDGKVVIDPKQAYLGRLGQDRFAVAQEREMIPTGGSMWTKDGSLQTFGNFSSGAIGSGIIVDGHNRTQEIHPKGQVTILERNGNQIGDVPLDRINRFAADRAWPVAAKSGANWGLLAANGSWLVHPAFERIEQIHSGYAAVLRDGRWGLIDESGRTVIEPAFAAPPRFAAGLLIGRIGDKWGATDLTGKLVIDAKFDSLWDFVGDSAPAAMAKKWGLINRAGQWLIEPRYDLVYRGFEVPGGLWTSHLDGKYGFITSEARVLMEPRFTSIPTVCPDGRILGHVDKKLHMFDKNGREITPARGEAHFWSSCTGPYNFTLDGKVGQVDQAMRETLPPVFDAVARPRAKFDGKWGLINADGTWRLPPEYDAINPVGSANALVKQDGKTGLIHIADRSWITTFESDEVCAIRDEVILSRSADRRRLLTPDGKLLFDVQSDRMSLLASRGLLMTRSATTGKSGFIDLTGRTIVEFAYDDVKPFSRGIAWVRSGDAWCAIDRRGVRVSALACAPVDPQEGAPGTITCRLQ